MHNHAKAPVVADVPRDRVSTGSSLVVLTRDPAFAETVRLLGSEHAVVTVGAESELAGELVGNVMGVAVIDASSVSTAIARLTEQLKGQFPDLVLIVAGGVNDQTALTTQITSGTVYRFLHKPLSEQRVRLFMEAAWRRHGEQHSGVIDPAIATDKVRNDRRPQLPNSLVIGSALLIAVVTTGGWLITRKVTPVVGSSVVAGAERDASLESLLGQADAALAAGALVLPPGRNAADLYREALRRNSSDSRATAGIEKVIDLLLSAAEEQLRMQHIEAAQKLTDQARAVEPNHVRVAFLSTRIAKTRERSVLHQARQAASGDIRTEATSVPGDADQAGNRTPSSLEARPEAQQNQLPTQARPEPQQSQLLAQALSAQQPNTPIVGARPEPQQNPPVAEAHREPGSADTPPAQHEMDTVANATVGTTDIEARHPVAEVQEVGTGNTNNATVEHDQTTTEPSEHATEIVPAGSLGLVRYVPPTFPVSARERGLSGWVDVQLLVKTDGSVSDVVITGAEPVGVFERAAVDAVKKWRYEPVKRDGHAIDQRARLRMKFALEQ